MLFGVWDGFSLLPHPPDDQINPGGRTTKYPVGRDLFVYHDFLTLAFCKNMKNLLTIRQKCAIIKMPNKLNIQIKGVFSLYIGKLYPFACLLFHC